MIATAPLAAPEAERLTEAFRLFNEVSAELSGAYTALQGQVERLTRELALANGELKRQYQEKAALTERLSLLLDALPAGVVVVDARGRVEKCNPAAHAILGEPLAGARWVRIAEERLHPCDAPEERRIAGAASTGGERRVSLAETELDSAGGRIVLLHDITHAHELKAQAQRNERLAAMGELVASAAHQLRTPLAAALLFAGNLQRPDLSDDDRNRCATRTVERLKALERLIQDMLIFARGEALGREAIPAAQIAGEAARAIAPLALEHGVALRVDDRAPDAVVLGSRKALVGALTNLLENALQHCAEDGRIGLDVAQRDARVRFAVVDDGAGIEPAVQARLFEPFFTTRAEGTGLGLAIARGVARAHGGAIEVRSAPGEGAEFALVLPLAQPGTDIE